LRDRLIDAQHSGCLSGNAHRPDTGGDRLLHLLLTAFSQ
jgi:hypothetical protein